MPLQPLESSCPVCAYQLAMLFFTPPPQPLATLGWPESPQAAQSMPLLPLTFVRCCQCGHVYNKDFDYSLVPYSQKPNRMFNQSSGWQEHLYKIFRLFQHHLEPNSTIIDIGCGDASFLHFLAEYLPSSQLIGFDPHQSSQRNLPANLTLFSEMFEPDYHLSVYQPHLISIRHVLEHLKEPLTFLQRLALYASWYGQTPLLFLEVPCIDKVFKSQRTVDFYYEHPSHFTSHSFERLLLGCSQDILLLEKDYHDEVIYGLVRLGNMALKFSQEALNYCSKTPKNRLQILSQLKTLQQSQKPIVIWGGTGKSAMFINYYDLTAQDFPLVVDSDLAKVGSYVPGQGQLIQPPSALLAYDGLIIVIPSQWRVWDIVAEIKSLGINWEHILIEHQGQLVDYSSISSS